MHFNAGPWARLIRELPLGKLFLLGVVALGISVGALYLSHETLPFLKPFLPLFACAGGVGVAALVAFVFRLLWTGGPKVHGVAAVIGGVALLVGAVRWYCLNVARDDARRACYDAAIASDPERRAASIAEGRARMEGFMFRLSQRFTDERDVENGCDFADTDEARRARGLCPREVEGDGPCRCGYGEYPRDAVRNEYCPRVTCEDRDGRGATFYCSPPKAPETASSAPITVVSARPADGWAARLDLDDLVKTEPVNLDNDYALRITLRGAAPDDLEAIRTKCRALFDKATPFLTTERPAFLLGPTGDHIALILGWEESDTRGITYFDKRLGKMTTVVESDGATVLDRADYAFEIEPVTEVSFENGKSIVCKGTILNLTDKPLDLTVECQIRDAGDKTPPKKGPREKISLKPHGNGTYEVHPVHDEGVLHAHVFRERGQEEPIASFNRTNQAHAKDWIALHAKLRRSSGVRFYNPYPSLHAEHKDYGSPDLSLPDGWEDWEPKKREEAAKEIWKGMVAHYRRYHENGVSTVELYAGKEKTWTIEQGKLKRKAP